MVKIQLYHTDYDYVYDVGNEGLPSGVPEISGDTLSAVLELPNVEAAALYNRRTSYNNSFYYGNNELSGCEVYGIDNTYFTTAGYVLQRGRTFVPKDFSQFFQNCSNIRFHANGFLSDFLRRTGFLLIYAGINCIRPGCIWIYRLQYAQYSSNVL